MLYLVPGPTDNKCLVTLDKVKKCFYWAEHLGTLTGASYYKVEVMYLKSPPVSQGQSAPALRDGGVGAFFFFNRPNFYLHYSQPLF